MPRAKAEKANAAAGKPERKKRAKESEPVDDVDVDDVAVDDVEGSPTPSKRKRKAKKDEPFVPRKIDDWQAPEPFLLYRDFGGTQPTDKIAAFDLDGTLVVNKSSRDWPRDPEDYKLWNKTMPKELKRLHKEGFKIVVFSNQGAIKSALDGKMSSTLRKRVENIMEELDVPVLVFYATGQDHFRKPKTGMWDYMTAHCNGGIAPDKSKSFFVGDAAGRKNDAGRKDDFADSDKEGPKKDITTKGPAPENCANPELAQALKKLAEHLEGVGETWPARAMKKVSDVVAHYPEKITEGKQLKHIQGVGKGSIAKIDEFLTTGKLAALEKAAEDAPEAAAAAVGAAAGGASGAKPAGGKEMAMAFL